MVFDSPLQELCCEFKKSPAAQTVLPPVTVGHEQGPSLKKDWLPAGSKTRSQAPKKVEPMRSVQNPWTDSSGILSRIACLSSGNFANAWYRRLLSERRRLGRAG